MIDWIQSRPEGIYCVPGEFYLDPSRGVPRSVISHAHADHYPRFCHEVHATAETLHLAQLRYQKLAAKVPQAHAYGERFAIGPTEVTLYPAGHVLGSAQVLVEYKGQAVLYTGDICFEDNPTCAALRAPERPIDLLICESTFGEKEHHPDAAAALRDMLERAGKRHVLIATYPLGKAQRINRLLHDLRPDLPVFVDHAIMPIHQAYRQYGWNPGQALPYRRQDVKRLHRQWVKLLPPVKMTGFFKDREFYKVFASGWDKTEKTWVNGQLEVSDHASQAELERYVLQLRPKAVRFWHGYPSQLIATCKAAGIDAAELEGPRT